MQQAMPMVPPRNTGLTGLAVNKDGHPIGIAENGSMDNGQKTAASSSHIAPTGVPVNVPLSLAHTNADTGGGNPGPAPSVVIQPRKSPSTSADTALPMGAHHSQLQNTANWAEGNPASAVGTGGHNAQIPTSFPPHTALPLPHQAVPAGSISMPSYITQMAPQMPPHLAQQMASQLNAQFPMPNLISMPQNGSPSSHSNEGEHVDTVGQLIGKSGKPLRNTKRAAQNRSAQKAFRQRRERYIKDLETKAKEFDRLDAQVAALSQENDSLKRYVLDLEQRLGMRRAPS
ncbi:LANO_0B04412g1_1 [Lachancea nothofagi CBS 11611]|uniref:Putative transcription factor kapC n=1 Tax=Lachancea nothofagi CBS 11611 TaxID=1266666 RepID=A0A1G4IY54_9SACH|nr:LANO_0B04412g1_1 [Lachancea nothofagi CBS 11611]